MTGVEEVVRNLWGRLMPTVDYTLSQLYRIWPQATGAALLSLQIPGPTFEHTKILRQGFAPRDSHPI